MSADHGFAAAPKSASEGGYTAASANQTFIFVNGEWVVCERGHWVDVRKSRMCLPAVTKSTQRNVRDVWGL